MTSPASRRLAELRSTAEPHLSRRRFMSALGRIGALLAALKTTTSPSAALARSLDAPATSPPFSFKELTAGIDGSHHVAEGYEARPLLSWGDPLFEDAPAFDPEKQSVESQLRQFGTNNDFIGFIPLDDEGNRGLLCVNHEYAQQHMMFADAAYSSALVIDSGPERTRIEMAAIGGSIVEINRTDNDWATVKTSKYNRRITVLETAMTIDGPAAGHTRMMTSADPTGRTCLGTLANCAGGITPWGTWLMPEENFHLYFLPPGESRSGRQPPTLDERETASRRRYDIPGSRNVAGWGHYVDRFDLAREPNEPNRYGWIVEVDPLEPGSTPVKHTALGRFRHEGAENAIAKSGQIVVYSGDDDKDEFIYKFVSSGTFRPGDRNHNKTLLSEGTLYAARFDADGTGTWLKLAPGEGKLAGDPRFATMADILIDARLAATAAGATEMDRPEDVEPGPGGRVIATLTNNDGRKNPNPANPRVANDWGHVIELLEADGDPASTRFSWSYLVICGDPKSAPATRWHPDTSTNGWFCCPDNVAFDPFGRLWVATDQGTKWDRISGKAEGLYAVDLDGEKRGRSQLFFRAPVGAEVGGPRFTPDGTTLFLSVQHPSADNTKGWAAFGRHSSAQDPATRWPAGPDSKFPPRASVMVITKVGGGKIAA